MKSLFLRSGVAIACALSVAACGGGGDDTLLLGGTVTGVTKPGVVLQNNGKMDLELPPGASSFTFREYIESDSGYEVTVKDPLPSGVTCTVTNGKGKAGEFNIMSVQLACITEAHQLGGKINNLKNGGLVIVNGSVRQEIAANATEFSMRTVGADGKPVLSSDGKTFSGDVADGSPYGITVLTQPANQTCTVQNGGGTMGKTDIMTVVINC